mgnify:CR=1 FL=1
MVNVKKNKNPIILFIIFILIIIILLYIQRLYLEKEKFNNMIILPINSYIIKNMNLTVKGTKINSWITKNNVKEIMNNVNNIFFNKYNIHWDLKEIIEYNVPNTANLKFIEESTRNTNKFSEDDRFKAYCSLIKKNMYSKKYNNIYFSTFNGNTRQGNANINKKKI